MAAVSSSHAFISFAEGSEPDTFSMGVRDNGDEFAISKGPTMDADPRFTINYSTGAIGGAGFSAPSASPLAPA